MGIHHRRDRVQKPGTLKIGLFVIAFIWTTLLSSCMVDPVTVPVSPGTETAPDMSEQDTGQIPDKPALPESDNKSEGQKDESPMPETEAPNTKPSEGDTAVPDITSPEEEKLPDASAEPEHVVLSPEARMIEAGKAYSLEVPVDGKGYAVLMNFREDSENDLTLRNVRITTDAPEEKAIITTPGNYGIYEDRDGHVTWNGMPNFMGERIVAAEMARDTNMGIMFMVDTTIPKDLYEYFVSSLQTLYSKNRHAFPPNTMREAEELAGITPQKLYKASDGHEYLMILVEDFGSGLEGVNGICSLYPYIYGTEAVISLSATAFSPDINGSFAMASTIAHEYSHLLDIEHHIAAGGEPGFECHLLSEGYADWAGVKASNHSAIEEADYLLFWLENSESWTPGTLMKNEQGLPLDIADYGIGSMLWERLSFKKGGEAVQSVLSAGANDYAAYENASGSDFSLWLRELVLDFISAAGAVFPNRGNLNYIMKYRPSMIWHAAYDAEPPLSGNMEFPMASCGMKVIPLPSGTTAFEYEGAESCWLFTLPE